MRNDYGNRPFTPRFPYGNKDGKESTKSQSMKSRRDESKGMEKAMGNRAYSSVKTMDK